MPQKRSTAKTSARTILTSRLRRTLRRHQTKDKRTEFGEEEMRRWWNEKGLRPALNEQALTPDMMQDEIIDRICADLERLDT